MAGTIEFTGFGRTFRTKDGTVEAVADFNLFVEDGSFVSIIGPSGCGKSTLLRGVAGLDPGYAGSLSVDGARVAQPSPVRGIVFQEPRLFPWMSLVDNIGFGLRGARQERRKRVGQLIELVGLDGFENAYPHELSGGMAQRGAIARALAPRPKVLLMDEPFGALDAFTRIRLQDVLEEIWQTERLTTLFVTHDIDEAVTLAERVVVMTARPGRLKEVVDIDIDYPRGRGDQRVLDHRTALLEAFHLDRPTQLAPPPQGGATPHQRNRLSELVSE